MSQSFQRTRRVEFRDTDMAGIVHFSVFFAYMEETEHEFLRSLGMGVIYEVDGQTISWPRVRAECNYRNAIRFEEEIDIEIRVQRIGTKSVTYAFQFSRDGAPVADGITTVVCCNYDHQLAAKPESVPIPQAVIEKLSPYAQS